MGRKHERRKQTARETQTAVAAPRVLPFLEKHARLIAAGAVLFASLRIVATYTVFNHTVDEPAHIACGMEWLDKGRYTHEPQHPPLARVAAALGPYLLGGHSEGHGPSDFQTITNEGLRILSAGHGYDLTLALARAGILPFFWIGCLVVYEWGRRYYNAPVAVLAVCLFSFLPPILAHSGLATTDIAVAAFLGAAFLTMLMWLDQPTPARAALFGLCGGLAAASKFSSLVFLPAAVALAAVSYLAAERPSPRDLLRTVRRSATTLALPALVSFLVVWGIYRFSFGPVPFAGIRLPFPELYAGIRQVRLHNERGHFSYLLGQRGNTGWWYFFPVVLAVKTPLAFLLLLGVWAYLAARKRLGFRRWWLPLTFSGGVLAVSMTSRIDLGVRHILPVYVGFSLMAAAALHGLLEQAHGRKWQRAAVVVLCGWFAGSSLLSHPDYLPYFNELAGSHPENILAESDLDWGQDLKRLGKRLQELGATSVGLMSYNAADYQAFGIPPANSRIDIVHPPAGYTAISASSWKVTRFGLLDQYPNARLWPDLIAPTERVGKGMFLWYFPPAVSGGR